MARKRFGDQPVQGGNKAAGPFVKCGMAGIGAAVKPRLKIAGTFVQRIGAPGDQAGQHLGAQAGGALEYRAFAGGCHAKRTGKTA